MGKRLITQRRGSGTSLYRSPSHRHVDDVRLPAMSEGTAVIKDLIQAPGRTCPLAVLDLNGKTDYQLAVEGTKVGQTIVIGGTDVVAGNITTLSNIPEGTLVHNVEARPGDGGKFVKTAGSSGTVVSRGEKVMVLMPSGDQGVQPRLPRRHRRRRRRRKGRQASRESRKERAHPEVQVHSGIQDQGSRDEPRRPPSRWWKPRPRWRT